MNVLVIGSGAREHAIVATLNRASVSPNVFCCGSSRNPGILSQTQGYWTGDITDTLAIGRLAKDWAIDLAIIGPEAPLESGVADTLWQLSIPAIGPSASLARIETSKIFARALMEKYAIQGLPTYRSFDSLIGVDSFLQSLGEKNYVVKANGLMGGKGVKVACEHLFSFAEAMDFCQAILHREQTFIIEEKLIGQEFSLMGFCDGKRVIPMPVVQDHKRAFVGDRGPNTGGMGSYSDANHRLPFLLADEINAAQQINEAVLTALTAECNEPYIGILYGSFIATARGVFVIEFNARFGDPEALNVLPILESDFLEVCTSMVNGNLSQEKVRFAPLATVCKYAVPEGYPNDPIKGAVIDVTAVNDPSRLFLAAVDAQGDELVATGSRTAAYVGIADSLTMAEALAEKEISTLVGPLYHREDIGTAELIEKRRAFMHQLRKLPCA